jgi:hypothetical protein
MAAEETAALGFGGQWAMKFPGANNKATSYPFVRSASPLGLRRLRGLLGA